MRVWNTYWTCVDCLFFLANGDLPSANDTGTDDSTERDAEVIAGVERLQGFAPGAHLACSSSEETDRAFSWRHCECCLSPLGGSRHEATLLVPEGTPGT